MTLPINDHLISLPLLKSSSASNTEAGKGWKRVKLFQRLVPRLHVSLCVHGTESSLGCSVAAHAAPWKSMVSWLYRTTGQIRSIIIQDSQQLFGLCSFLFNFVLLFLSFFVPFVPLSSSRQDPMHFCCHVHQLSICMRSANELKSHWYLAQPWFSHLAGRMLQT